MSTLIPGLTDALLNEQSESRSKDPRVARELTVLSREVDRTRLNLCSVLWIAGARGELGASRGPGEVLSVCHERTSGGCGEVFLPGVWSYTNRPNGDGERVWKRGDQELGSTEMIGCESQPGLNCDVGASRPSYGRPPSTQCFNAQRLVISSVIIGIGRV